MDARFPQKARFARALLFLAVLAVFAGCSAEKRAVLVLDRFWHLSREPEEALTGLLREAERFSGMEISVLRAAEENIPAALEAFIDAREPEAVLVGAFSAMRLRPVAEKFPDLLFCVFDAPGSGIPKESPFAWVFFDRKPAMADLGATLRDFLDKAPAGAFAAAFLEPPVQDLWEGEAACGGFQARGLLVSEDEKAEALRGQVEEILAAKPALYLVAAGSRSAFILDLILQKGDPAPLILDDGEGLPVDGDFPVLAAFRRSYAEALGMALANRPRRGEIVRIPMKIH